MPPPTKQIITHSCTTTYTQLAGITPYEASRFFLKSNNGNSGIITLGLGLTGAVPADVADIWTLAVGEAFPSDVDLYNLMKRDGVFLFAKSASGTQTLTGFSY
jgi:hypothetical protein